MVDRCSDELCLVEALLARTPFIIIEQDIGITGKVTNQSSTGVLLVPFMKIADPQGVESSGLEVTQFVTCITHINADFAIATWTLVRIIMFLILNFCMRIASISRQQDCLKNAFLMMNLANATEDSKFLSCVNAGLLTEVLFCRSSATPWCNNESDDRGKMPLTLPLRHRRHGNGSNLHCGNQWRAYAQEPGNHRRLLQWWSSSVSDRFRQLHARHQWQTFGHKRPLL